MSYSAVPTNYDQTDIPQPGPIFPPHEHTQYPPEKQQFLVHERSDSESQRPYTTSHEQQHRSLGKTLKFLTVQIVAFLWIAPIAALLYFNISEWIIGASAWCPLGHCRPFQYGTAGKADALTLLAEFDHDSHNLLGALQFAAKALEVWFVLIASALVFRVTMILIHMKDGLPIGYLYRPMEYAEVTTLVDPELYRTLHLMPGQKGKHVKKRVAAFLCLTIVLCIICNLMGPAIAVLLIPQLQWIDTDKVGIRALTGLNANRPPGLSGFAFESINNQSNPDCSPEEFSSEQFSCTSTWSANLDAWISSYQGSQDTETAVFSVQDVLSFSYNSTYFTFDDGTNETFTFVPSRQVIQDLANDGYILEDMDSTGNNTDADSTYAQYVRSVQTYVHRQGPILGAITNLYADFDSSNTWWTVVDDDQYLRCYASYSMIDTPLCWGTCPSAKYGNYTRCISVGEGWNDGYKNASFAIGSDWKEYSDSFDGYFDVTFNVTVHASGKAAFLPNGTLPTGFSEDCLPVNGSVRSGTTCDWDQFFATGDEPEVQRHSKHVTTWEIESSPQNASIWDESADHASVTNLVIDFSVFQTMADYSYDPSSWTNPVSTIATSMDLAKHASLPNITVLPIDPAWTLATFGVNADGVMDGTRPFSSYLSVWTHDLAARYKDSDPLEGLSLAIDGVALMPVVQLLSLIDYNTTATDAKPTGEEDPAQPLLYRSAHLNAYAYSTDSRTSKVGIIVAIVGCVVVLAKVLLSLAVPKEYPGPLKLLIAAMEHRYNGEFRGVEEKMQASMPFKLNPDEDLAGGYRFGKRE